MNLTEANQDREEERRLSKVHAAQPSQLSLAESERQFVECICFHCSQPFQTYKPDASLCMRCFIAGHRGFTCGKYCVITPTSAALAAEFGRNISTQPTESALRGNNPERSLDSPASQTESISPSATGDEVEAIRKTSAIEVARLEEDSRYYSPLEIERISNIKTLLAAYDAAREKLMRLHTGVSEANWELSRHVDAGGGLVELRKWIAAYIEDDYLHKERFEENKSLRQQLAESEQRVVESELADKRHDELCAERRMRDEARALCAAEVAKAVKYEARINDLRAELATLKALKLTCADCKQPVTLETSNQHGFGRC